MWNAEFDYTIEKREEQLQEQISRKKFLKGKTKLTILMIDKIISGTKKLKII